MQSWFPSQCIWDSADSAGDTVARCARVARTVRLHVVARSSTICLPSEAQQMQEF